MGERNQERWIGRLMGKKVRVGQDKKVIARKRRGPMVTWGWWEGEECSYSEGNICI